MQVQPWKRWTMIRGWITRDAEGWIRGAKMYLVTRYSIDHDQSFRDAWDALTMLWPRRL